MTTSRAAAFPAHLTPLERQRLASLVERLMSDPGLSKVVVFGSRARGRSHVGSDLDVAVYFSSSRDRDLERWLGEPAASGEDDAEAPPLQIVPFFAGERPGRLDAALEREGIVLWTRN